MKCGWLTKSQIAELYKQHLKTVRFETVGLLALDHGEGQAFAAIAGNFPLEPADLETKFLDTFLKHYRVEMTERAIRFCYAPNTPIVAQGEIGEIRFRYVIGLMYSHQNHDDEQDLSMLARVAEDIPNLGQVVGACVMPSLNTKVAAQSEYTPYCSTVVGNLRPPERLINAYRRCFGDIRKR